MPDLKLSATSTLPADGFAGALAGRVWRPDEEGPSVVAIRREGVLDVSRAFPTMRDLCEAEDPAAALRAAAGVALGPLDAILANTPPDDRDPAKPWLLAPIDLQAIKAAGVTFAVSMLERVIEERARGNPAAATAIRGNEVERQPQHQADAFGRELEDAPLDLELLNFDLLLALYLVVGAKAFAITPQTGALGGELQLLYIFSVLAIVFLGSGRFALLKGRGRWD